MPKYINKSQEYWNNRSVVLSESLLNIGDDYYKSLAHEYEIAFLRIEKEIEAFYGRFAKDNKISFADSKRVLTSSEREKFMLEVDEYIKRAEGFSYSEKWSKTLENASAAKRVTRLQALQLQMGQQIEELYTNYNIGLTKVAENILTEGYYKNIYENQKYYGVGSPFATLDTEKVKNIIATPWDGSEANFSAKIWKDQKGLANYLNREMPQSFIRGESPDRLIIEIKKKFGVSSKNAARLVQTESAFFSARAKKESYIALGYKKYIIVAVIDGKTSPICRELDGEVFDIEDFIPGITSNPFHPRCRSTTAPFVRDLKGEKSKGLLYDHNKKKVYSIPKDITYKEWIDKYVENK